MNESHWTSVLLGPELNSTSENFTNHQNVTREEEFYYKHPKIAPLDKAHFEFFVPDIGYKVRKELKGEYTSEAWKCLTLECLCPFYNGKT